ncbi:MAG TPA: patatin-like phospholipase family protein [Burkholderiaceae bacterium]|nr:patatin-like phospholipase family protein [Burkholderiaceae bacterium]
MVNLLWPWHGRSRRLSLALQGGGAHGAFTWGVLDVLLERTAHTFAGVSGSSAGAVNAVLLAHGLLQGGRDGAREALALFWESLGRSVPWDALGLMAHDGSGLSAAGRMMMQWAQVLSLSPAQATFMRPDPLRDLLSRQVDFERLRAHSPVRLYIAATHANTGRLRLFTHDELSVDVVMASACLPTLQRAVVIDDEPYWDGAFSANPALSPLLHDRAADDLLVVMLSPWSLGDTPTTTDGIRLRTAEIAFNAAFLREMRLIADATSAARRSWWRGPLERRLRHVRWHMIDVHDALADLPAISKAIAHPQWLQRLRDAGRAQALAWLQRHAGSLGTRSSVDIARWFGQHGEPQRPDSALHSLP